MGSFLKHFSYKNESLSGKQNGFSLLELVIVIAIVALIAAIGTGFYTNYGKSIEINSVSETISFDLKKAQSEAMIGEGTFKWGLHFVNGVTDYYEIFSTPTNYSDLGKVVTATNYLPTSVTFSSPAPGFSTDIIFNKISGSTTASSIVLVSQSFTKTISVSGIGNITIQ